MKVLAVIALCAFADAALAEAPSINAIRDKLWTAPQIQITGQQAQFDPNKPGRVTQYEEFTLKFDRPTGRLRLSYQRMQLAGVKTEIEVWGTKDCLNLLRVASPWTDVRLRDCVKSRDLLELMREGSIAPVAPLPPMQLLLDQELLSGPAYGGQKITVGDSDKGVIMEAASPTGRVETRAWLASDGNSIAHWQSGQAPGYVRTNFTTRAVSLAEKDFAYSPSEEYTILAEAQGHDDDQSRAKVEALIAKGSRPAELQLRGRTLGALMFGYGKGPTDLEQTWNDLDRLGALGISAAIGMQGRWLAKAEPKGLPERFRNLSKQERIDQGKALMWKAAQLCDKETIEYLEHGYAPRLPGYPHGDDIFEPNVIKFDEVARAQKHCDDTAAGPELVKASNTFADPWPR